jgi:hypothetical protein
MGPALAALLLALVPARADYAVKDAPTVEGTGVPPAGTILFTDGRTDPKAPETALTRFTDWARARPAEKELLALYPGYKEPDYTVTLHGTTKPRHEALHVYVAQARFTVARPADGIDLKRYTDLAFVQKMDPQIKQKALSPADATPEKDPQAAFAKRPDRAWCASPGATCIESRYDLEGKLPLGVRLANKLEEGGKKVAEFVSFQSELRAIPAAEAASLGSLTKLGTPVAGAIEQDIFWVNQILRFGKFLAVFQPDPADAGRTVVTAYVVLGIKSDVLERKKEYERVPVLRNLLPAQVLMGTSSFNTGTSISAGLPTYARNRLAAFADALAAK